MTKRINKEEINFSQAPLFRKMASIPKVNVQIAKGGEEIITKHPEKNGKDTTETKNVAKEGDRIVTRSPGDSYIITADNFNKLYTENDTHFISSNLGRAVLVEEDVIISVSWQKDQPPQDQSINAGGVIFRSEVSGEIYGNQAHTFEADFARQGSNPKNLCPLSLNLQEQEKWAKDHNEQSHLKDVQQRIDFKRKH